MYIHLEKNQEPATSLSTSEKTTTKTQAVEVSWSGQVFYWMAEYLYLYSADSMTCVRCRDDISVHYFRLIKDAVGSDSILIVYSALSNSLVDDEFLESKDIHLMNW